MPAPHPAIPNSSPALDSFALSNCGRVVARQPPSIELRSGPLFVSFGSLKTNEFVLAKRRTTGGSITDGGESASVFAGGSRPARARERAATERRGQSCPESAAIAGLRFSSGHFPFVREISRKASGRFS